ncbi:DUF302 domain-containing protein [Gramella sp. MT6]|uniref:DUF302 domain-containing protein n=1 Tax=Gramella sp. MT6 TaxID=2705471 RepID=UPI001C605886|nr:DUF302 domain-containing protein [Gramella sp. MT6]QYA24227.1 DUF302 domain-containing protein [Gramella sp. MT6]
MKKILLLVAIIFVCVSYSQTGSERTDTNFDQIQGDKEVQMQADSSPGVNYAFSKVDLPQAYDHLKQKLKNNGGIGIIAEIDHAENAKSIGEKLDYSKIIFFGNPKLGTPLMQKNQLAGLDLPQKILFFQNSKKQNMLLFNNIDYLRSRYSLEGVPTLDKISNALESLVSEAAQNVVQQPEKMKVNYKEGVVTLESTRSFEETYANLKNAIMVNPGIHIMAELDHQQNANRVGMELHPTRIIIFGNPELGTPLMQEQPGIALDLPQKILVWENSEGKVFVSYNDPFYIAKRHSLENKEEILEKIAGALSKLANAATGN